MQATLELTAESEDNLYKSEPEKDLLYTLPECSTGVIDTSSAVVFDQQPSFILDQCAQQEVYKYLSSHLAELLDGTSDLLHDTRVFSDENWPIYYPRLPASSDPPPLNRARSAAVLREDTSNNRPYSAPSSPIKRSSYRETHSTEQEKKRASSREDEEEEDSSFNVLKLNLNGYYPDSLPQLERASIARLFSSRSVCAQQHLGSLKQRVLDTSSKILVTGDLNSGKSTLCNSLLRRAVLPEDQQPCTEVFCEVLDAQSNHNQEEVHALMHSVSYDMHDESSYQAFSLDKLEDLITQTENYCALKVYIHDNRSQESSLINNGVVDISLVDAPGLNTDSIKTTAVFARQEEIDVVVFVVSAENHFTLSAKEFLWQAANEKAYLFIVVNKFDMIKNKERCKEQILRQLGKLSPATYANAAELVHFVAANKTMSEDNPEFNNLEANLRTFVLEKRTQSKLLPAKTYLENLLNDLANLIDVNVNGASDEIKQASKELIEIEPRLDQSIRLRQNITDESEKIIARVTSEVSKFTRRSLTNALASLEDVKVEYRGIFSLFKFSEDVRNAMVAQINTTVYECEEYSRKETKNGVDSVRGLGTKYLSQNLFDRQFQPDTMFSGRKGRAERHLVVNLDVYDFWPHIVDYRETVTTSASFALVPVLAGRFFDLEQMVVRMFKMSRLLSNDKIRKWIVLGASLAVGTGVFYFVTSSISRNVPRNISRKIRVKAEEADFVAGSADRISKECRAVLRVPAEHIKIEVTRDLEKHVVRRDECRKMKQEAMVALDFFDGISGRVKHMQEKLSSLVFEMAA